MTRLSRSPRRVVRHSCQTPRSGLRRRSSPRYRHRRGRFRPRHPSPRPTPSTASKSTLSISTPQTASKSCQGKKRPHPHVKIMKRYDRITSALCSMWSFPEEKGTFRSQPWLPTPHVMRAHRRVMSTLHRRCNHKWIEHGAWDHLCESWELSTIVLMLLNVSLL